MKFFSCFFFHSWTQWAQITHEIWADGKIVAYRSAQARQCIKCLKRQIEYLT